MINKIIANDLGVVMEIQKFTNNATTSADMLRRYQDMIVENQGDEDLEEATDDNEDQVDEAQEEVDEDQVDEAKDEDEKEEVKEEIPSTNMLRRYQDMIKEAEKEDEEVDESKEEEVDESKEEEVDESKDEEVDEGVKRTPRDAYDRKVVKPAHEIGKGVGKYSGSPDLEKDLADFPGIRKSVARATARGRISDGHPNPRHGGTGVGVPRG